jgi:outer membrane protein assembly factor BamB
MKHFFTLNIVALILLSLVITHGEDWPEFRGATGQGHSSERNLPTEWSTSKNVEWKKEIPGKAWSSPVVHGGRVYLSTSVESGSDYSLRALCLDAKSGAILWNAEAIKSEKGSAPGIHNKNSHASPTPLVANERLYVHFGHQGTACLDLNGQVLWRNTNLKYSPVHGNGGSPALVDDALVFNCDGGADPFVAALNKNTGELLWKVPRRTDADKTFSFSTPLIITVDGKKQVISPGSNMVCALDPRTGEEIWRVKYNGYSIVPRPVYSNGLLYIATGFDRPTVIAIRPDGVGDVTNTKVVWTVNRGAPNTPSLLVIDSELYMVSDGGIATCVDAKTGAIHWQERVGGNYSASPVFADGKIYLQNEQGTGVVLKAGKTFEKLASNPLEERALASYAIADEALFIRTEQHLYRIQKR